MEEFIFIVLAMIIGGALSHHLFIKVPTERKKDAYYNPDTYCSWSDLKKNKNWRTK